MNNSLPQRIVNELSAHARKNGVRKVIMFGSRARGTHTPRSDVDIAVCGGDFDAFYWSVKEEINSLLSFDIVSFDANLSSELKKEIERDGVTLYEEAG